MALTSRPTRRLCLGLSIGCLASLRTAAQQRTSEHTLDNERVHDVQCYRRAMVANTDPQAGVATVPSQSATLALSGAGPEWGTAEGSWGKASSTTNGPTDIRVDRHQQ